MAGKIEGPNDFGIDTRGNGLGSDYLKIAHPTDSISEQLRKEGNGFGMPRRKVATDTSAPPVAEAMIACPVERIPREWIEVLEVLGGLDIGNPYWTGPTGPLSQWKGRFDKKGISGKPGWEAIRKISVAIVEGYLDPERADLLMNNAHVEAAPDYTTNKRDMTARFNPAKLFADAAAHRLNSFLATGTE